MIEYLTAGQKLTLREIIVWKITNDLRTNKLEEVLKVCWETNNIDPKDGDNFFIYLDSWRPYLDDWYKNYFGYVFHEYLPKEVRVFDDNYYRVKKHRIKKSSDNKVQVPTSQLYKWIMDDDKYHAYTSMYRVIMLDAVLRFYNNIGNFDAKLINKYLELPTEFYDKIDNMSDLDKGDSNDNQEIGSEESNGEESRTTFDEIVKQNQTNNQKTNEEFNHKETNSERNYEIDQNDITEEYEETNYKDNPKEKGFSLF